jgi:hypothetical protein
MKPHAVLLRPPRELDPGAAARAAAVAGAPAILQRGDDDFVDAILEELRSDAGRAGLATNLAAARVGGVLKLFQPVQRQFHVAVLEAVCDAPGFPRIDPARVESAGMVLRRVQFRRRASDALQRGRSAARVPVREGWMRAAGRLRGWVEIDPHAEADERHDPSPANRLARKALGPPALARRLAAQAAELPGALLAEDVLPLFLAPPDVCTEAGKTLYYGLVPTTSSDVSEAPGEMPSGFEPGSTAFRNHLMGPLRGDAATLPGGGSAVQPAWRDIADIPPDPGGHQALVTVFVKLLRQLAIEFDAFGESAASRALFAELEAIRLPLQLRSGETTPRTVTAGSFLQACVPVLLERDDDATRPEMPVAWPALNAAATSRLMAALGAALAERFKTVQARAGRFDQAGARYQLRAFLRIKPECGCPARTVWSDYSEPFTIAPWYDGAGAPPVQVQLPDATDRNLLKSLKPNVAFVVPAALNNLLGNKPDDFMEGNATAPPSPDLQWICGFSIPIITICAFIVLNIFLSLFDLIFRWFLFIKICIPFPKISTGGNGGGGS